jgi:hypothetical protein
MTSLEQQYQDNQKILKQLSLESIESNEKLFKLSPDFSFFFNPNITEQSKTFRTSIIKNYELSRSKLQSYIEHPDWLWKLNGQNAFMYGLIFIQCVSLTPENEYYLPCNIDNIDDKFNPYYVQLIFGENGYQLDSVEYLLDTPPEETDIYGFRKYLDLKFQEGLNIGIDKYFANFDINYNIELTAYTFGNTRKNDFYMYLPDIDIGTIGVTSQQFYSNIKRSFDTKTRKYSHSWDEPFQNNNLNELFKQGVLDAEKEENLD